jgi:hypothetical protein
MEVALTDLACRGPPLRRDAAGQPLRSTVPSSFDPRLAAGSPPRRAIIWLHHHRVWFKEDALRK